MVSSVFILSEFEPAWGSQYMQPFLWLVFLALIFSAGLGFAMGANDVANSFGTSVGARVLSLKQAVILAGIFALLGSMFLGANVTETIKSKIVDLELFASTPHIYMSAMVAAYIGAFSLVMGATVVKMPVSTTHSIIGGVLGASLAAYGNAGVDWFTFGMVCLGWVAAPIFAGLFTAFFYLTQQRILTREPNLAKQLVKQMWYASFQVGLIAWMLTFFLVTKVISDIPDWLKVSKLGKGAGKPTWPGSLALPLVCFAVMGVVMIFSRAWFIPAIFRAVERDHPKLHLQAQVNIEDKEVDDEVKELKTNNPSYIEEVLALGNPEEPVKETPSPVVKELAQPKCWDTDDLFTLNHEDKPYALQKHVRKQAAALHDAADAFPKQIEVRFKGVQIITACFMEMSHGANDIANVIGPLAGCLEAWNDGTLTKSAPSNYPVLAFGGVFIVLGLATYGARVMATIGHNTTLITPSRGVNVELGAAFAVTIASYLGIPTSTTQCVMGSIIAVGLCNKNRTKTVDFTLFGMIFITWILTPIIAGLIAASFFKLLNLIGENQVPEDFFPLSNVSEMYGVHYEYKVFE